MQKKLLAQKLIGNLDLTSLNSSDTEKDITSLCQKAQTTFGNTAAVCVYQQFTSLAKSLLKNTPISVATVINFPHGSSDISSTKDELLACVNNGADEIDAVFPYQDFLHENIDICKTFLETLTQNKNRKKIKIILESGAFSDQKTLAQACLLCLQYDIDFLKTSTGKTSVSATPEAVKTIIDSIKSTSSNVGIKVSGGIKTFAQAEQYYNIIKNSMGESWLTPQHFRIGASSLLDNLIQEVKG